MGKIRLKGIEVYAHHGCTDEEQKIGNKFTIDVEVKTDFSKAAASDNLADTPDYAILNTIVKEEMQASARLLEHLAHRINERTLKELPEIKWVKTNIYKHRPPFGGKCAFSNIELKSKRKS